MAQSTFSGMEQDIWQTIEAFNRAFAANNPEQYFTFIDADIVVLTPGNPYRVEGIVDDRAEFEFGIKEGYSRVSYFQEMQPHIRVYGETAVVTYFTRGRYGTGEKARTAFYKETNVLIRRATGWKIVHIHVSATT
jgi:ketosteroid isomerase-like protein